jgi:hypothetical protein
LTWHRFPGSEWDAIAALGLDAVRLTEYGRGPAGIAIDNGSKALLDDFWRTLQNFRLTDNVGFRHCVRRYAVDEHLGARWSCC